MSIGQLLLVSIVLLMTACGGSGSSNTPATPNPADTTETPNTFDQARFDESRFSE